MCVCVCVCVCVYVCVCVGVSEVEITVGHRTFSVHIAQMAELSCVCADIMSGHSLDQQLRTVVAYNHNLLFTVLMVNDSLH